MPLDDVVHFPVTVSPITPASILEDDRVATEVAVARRLVKNSPQGCFCHQFMMPQTRPKWIVTVAEVFWLGGVTNGAVDRRRTVGGNVDLLDAMLVGLASLGYRVPDPRQDFDLG